MLITAVLNSQVCVHGNVCMHVHVHPCVHDGGSDGIKGSRVTEWGGQAAPAADSVFAAGDLKCKIALSFKRTPYKLPSPPSPRNATPPPPRPVSSVSSNAQARQSRSPNNPILALMQRCLRKNSSCTDVEFLCVSQKGLGCLLPSTQVAGRFFKLIYFYFWSDCEVVKAAHG